MNIIAINGFGRIGRALLRTIMLDETARSRIQVAVINVGPGNIAATAHLFTYDTIMGTFPESVYMDGNTLIINETRIAIIAECAPDRLDWQQYSVHTVVDCSGCFTKRSRAQVHIAAGARHVVISAPAQDEDIAIIPGVNDHLFDPAIHAIISIGSCTTNALLPTLKVLHDNFEIINGYMTTVHAYTNDQVLLDVEHHDLRRARAAALNIIPTSTGVTKMIDKVIPALAGMIHGQSIRVPVGTVSLIDLTVTTRSTLTTTDVNQACATAAKTTLAGIMGYTEIPLVSSDYCGDSRSVIIDGLLTQTQNNTAKIFGWYDNEWGYSCRLRDFIMHF